MSEELRAVIADVATGAGQSADALRRAGIDVELLGYTIEVIVDPADTAPAATLTLTFGGARETALTAVRAMPTPVG